MLRQADGTITTIDGGQLHLSTQPGLAAIDGNGNHLVWRENSSWQVADLI